MKKFPISIHNSGPRYIRLPNFLSYFDEDPDIAKKLMAFHQENENQSSVNISNDVITEVRFSYTLDESGKKESWFSENNVAAAKVQECLLPVMEITNQIFPYNSPISQISTWESCWIIKYEPNPNRKNHDITPEDIHYDFNSHEKDGIYSRPWMSTLSIALNDDYEGGDFVISNGFNADDNKKEKDKKSLRHEFTTLTPKMKAGDGVLIDGWSLHGVAPVTQGARYVFLAHFAGTFKTGTKNDNNKKED